MKILDPRLMVKRNYIHYGTTLLSTILCENLPTGFSEFALVAISFQPDT